MALKGRVATKPLFLLFVALSLLLVVSVNAEHDWNNEDAAAENLEDYLDKEMWEAVEQNFGKPKTKRLKSAYKNAMELNDLHEEYYAEGESEVKFKWYWPSTWTKLDLFDRVMRAGTSFLDDMLIGFGHQSVDTDTSEDGLDIVRQSDRLEQFDSDDSSYGF